MELLSKQWDIDVKRLEGGPGGRLRHLDGI